MPFAKGKSGNPGGRSKGEKIYRKALLMELAEAGEDFQAIRRVARAHIARCNEGDMSAIREFADRLDGKVPQAIIGDEDDGPVKVAIEVSWKRATSSSSPDESNGDK